jgi:hypothetical protein
LEQNRRLGLVHDLYRNYQASRIQSRLGMGLSILYAPKLKEKSRIDDPGAVKYPIVAERFTGSEEVTGSIQLSTKTLKQNVRDAVFLF